MSLIHDLLDYGWGFFLLLGIGLLISTGLFLYIYGQNNQNWALLAIIISLFSFGLTGYVGFKQFEAIRIDSRKALVVAEFCCNLYNLGNTGKPQTILTLKNIGLSVAKNVSVKINGVDSFNDPNIMYAKDQYKIESIEYIAPNSKFQYWYNYDLRTNPIFKVTVMWSDDYYDNNKTETILSIVPNYIYI